jgi:chromosome segregation ATPase
MHKERQILRRTKLKYKEELASLKHYLHELSHKCKECHTDHHHFDADHMKAKNDAQFYESRIKDINARLKELKVKKTG